MIAFASSILVTENREVSHEVFQGFFRPGGEQGPVNPPICGEFANILPIDIREALNLRDR